jgi:hypothetical protein
MRLHDEGNERANPSAYAESHADANAESATLKR